VTIEEQWRNAATSICKSPLNTRTRHKLIDALMRGESVIIDGTLLVKYEDPLGEKLVFGQNQLGYGTAAGETFDLRGCADAVAWAEAQIINPEK
jgi:hypothetical protein